MNSEGFCFLLETKAGQGFLHQSAPVISPPMLLLKALNAVCCVYIDRCLRMN